jgi:hypothetical protein
MGRLEHYVIMFVSDLQHVCGFHRVLWFRPPIKQTDRHDWAEILLKVAFNTITLTLKPQLGHYIMYMIL